MKRFLLALAVTCWSGTALAERTPVMVVFQPRRKAVLSAEISSVVRRLHRELGQRIEKGEPLITLDDQVFRASVEQAEARLQTARAKLGATEKLSKLDPHAARITKMRAILRGARTRLKSKEKLFADNSLSTADLESARTDVAVAEAELELALQQGKTRKIELARELAVDQAATRTAAAGLRLARKELSACRVLAPFSGRLSRAIVNAHEVVRPGQHLIEVVDDRTLLAQFLVPSKLVFELKLGQPARIVVQETGKPVSGKISHIGALVDPSSSTILVKVEVSNPAGLLRGGMRGRLELSELVSGARK